MNISKNDKTKIYKKSFFKNFFTGLINIPVRIMHLTMAYIGINPGFVGQKRLARSIYNYLNPGNEIILKPTGIYQNDRLLESFDFDVMRFIPSDGIKFENKDLLDIKETLCKAISRKNPNVSKSYYRLYGLGTFIVLAYLGALLFLGFMLTQEYKIPTLTEKILNLLWFTPNIFFFTQAIIFYITRLNHFSLKHSFSEAGEVEENQIYTSLNQPYVISVVPAYMEEPELLKRTLYSICLQKYINMKVYLLLGNDVLSSDEKVIENTRKVKRLVLDIKKEFRTQRKKIKSFFKDLEKYSGAQNDISLKKALAYSGISREISEWFLQKSHEIENDTVKYPIDSYLIENTFRTQYVKFNEYSNKCLEMVESIKDGKISEDLLKGFEKELENLNIDLKQLFKIDLGVFMRTKYENLEQEKTKAGNLSAFSSIIGMTFKREKQESGRYSLVHSPNGITVKQPKYFASFDSDTILKPQYIIRKVAFLEREENRKTGLIQSPYIVPDPEETNVATASGIHTSWFLPMSVGFSPIKSAYWLGFNGVLRFETVRKIKSFITDTIIEDTQNSIKMKQEGYEIVTSAEENCITFSPKDIGALKIQRIRWASGGFKIAKNLITSFLKGNSGMKGFWEKVLSVNYVMGLNFLPIAIFIFTFLRSPFNYKYFFAETLPFFLYLLSYFVLLKTQTKYKLSHMLDGLAITPFLIIYYITGTLKSLNSLIVANQKRFFASTPKKEKSDLKWVGNLEIAGIIIILLWSWIRLVAQFSEKVYFDFYPILQITLILYGVDRFWGWEKIGSYILTVKKTSLFKDTSIILRNTFINIKNQNYSKAAKIASIVVLCVIIAGVSINSAVDYNYRKDLSNEVNEYIYVKSSNRSVPDPFEQNKKLGKGLNIAGALEAPNEGDWLLRLNEDYFKIIKKAGFDTIRVPICWTAHTSKKSPYKIDSSFFERIDWLLLQAKKNNLKIVLDLHNFYDIYIKDPEVYYEQFIDIWKQIAERYKDCDDSVYYELINEPRDNLSISRWNDLLYNTIIEVRNIDKYHTIIIDASRWGSAFGFVGLQIPQEEKNVICSFHTYTPQMFTHQGAEYAPDEFRYSQNVAWPGPPKKPIPIPEKVTKYQRAITWIEEYNTLPYEENPAGPKPILEELDFAYDWGLKNKRPIWLGEFGAINNTDEESQIRWSSFVAREAEKRGITWAYWDFADTCRIYDIKKKEWKEGLLNALMQKNSNSYPK